LLGLRCPPTRRSSDLLELEQRAARLIEGKLGSEELLIDTAYDKLAVVPADLSLRKLDLLLDKHEAGKNFFKSLLKPLNAAHDLRSEEHTSELQSREQL